MARTITTAKNLTDLEKRLLEKARNEEIGEPVQPSPQLLDKINSQQELNDFDIDRAIAKKKAAAAAEKARNTG